MKSVSPERVIAHVSVVVPMILLVLYLSAPKFGGSRRTHGQVVSQASRCPYHVGGRLCVMDTNSRPHIQPMIQDMISTAVSIADRM
jgi:hypothetical protein